MAGTVTTAVAYNGKLQQVHLFNNGDLGMSESGEVVVVQGEKAAPYPSFVALALHLLGTLTSQSEPSLMQADKTRPHLPAYAASIILTLKVAPIPCPHTPLPSPPSPASIPLHAL